VSTKSDFWKLHIVLALQGTEEDIKRFMDEFDVFLKEHHKIISHPKMVYTNGRGVIGTVLREVS